MSAAAGRPAPLRAIGDVTPSRDGLARVRVSTAGAVPATATAVVVPVAAGELATGAPARLDALLPGALPPTAVLAAAGFHGAAGQQVAVPAGDRVLALSGLGDDPDPAAWRDAAAAGSRAAPRETRVALVLPVDGGAEVVQAAVEGLLLARYRYDALRAEPAGHPVAELTVVVGGAAGSATGAEQVAAAAWVAEAARRGVVLASATALARDLANAPHNHLTAARFADVAAQLGAAAGLEVEVYDRARVVAEGLGGLLAVNAGSAEEPRVVRLRYAPAAPAGRLALVGKGIMYDSGGIGLKPNNDAHAQMKNDMTGAAAILAAMLALPDLGGAAEVVGYLMCTDNMPSATATALGDVVRMRDGRSVEVIDTDAEGRMVLADGLALAVEDDPDAIVDIATLTGSVSRALGPAMAGLVGSDDVLVAAVRVAGERAGEPTWQLPLAPVYRPALDSPVADLRNVGPMGMPDGLIAAVFLHEFVAGRRWAHLDIAGTAWQDGDRGWHSPGCTGFGARLLAELATGFRG